MKKLFYLGLCALLTTGVGCAITNYELITDNDQVSNGQGSGVVNTNGKAMIKQSSQIALIWPDGADTTVWFVDQAANGDQTLEERPGVSAQEGEVAAAVAALVGTFDQVPPAYSAIKVGGVRSYALARKGREIPLAARRVTVRGAGVLSESPGGFRAVLTCSQGFYVRSLPRDFGERLGIPMTVAGLRRLRVGPFRAEDAVTLDALREAAGRGDAARLLVPIADALAHYPQWVVPAADVSAVRNGRLAGGWMAQCAEAERGKVALLVAENREPLALAGRDPAGLWKILRGI